MNKNNLKFIFALTIITFLSSCASTPEIYNMRIKINTVDVNNNPLDAICTIFSSSNKKDIIAPTQTTFATECSSLNVVCKSGDLKGQNGHIEDIKSSNTIVNTGIGFIFNRAIDAITPMGQLLNIFNDGNRCDNLRHEIKVVLE